MRWCAVPENHMTRLKVKVTIKGQIGKKAVHSNYNLVFSLIDFNSNQKYCLS